MEKLEKLPELVAFSQFKLGGIQSFYYNILSSIRPGVFDIKWIFEDVNDNDPKLPKLFGLTNETVFTVDSGKDQTIYEVAARLQKLISNRPGVVLANFKYDLITLHLYRRPAKTIFFICHDEGYVPIAIRFEFLIDVFVAHNYQFYEELVSAMPSREKDIYFIPFGVNISEKRTSWNSGDPLRIVIAARMQVLKGVYDIPIIDNELKQKGIIAQWTIIGDGPEKKALENLLVPRGNFFFHAPADNNSVRLLMQDQDIFILPSRLDGLPVAMLEAMSAGCVPVISAFNEGIRNIVTPDVGYTLPVGDTAQFSNAIACLNSDRADLARKSRNASELIKDQYNIVIQSKKYFDLFCRFAELKKPLRRRFHKYGGWLDYPVFPRKLRFALRKIKSAI